MEDLTERLEVPEAAIAAHVTPRRLNRVIDEEILSEGFASGGKARSVAASACSLVEFYFATEDDLTASVRKAVIRRAEEKLRGLRRATWADLLAEDWVVRRDYMTIDMAPFFRSVRERLGRLAQARDMVVETPEILAGTPVIKGTRIPVHDVAALAAAPDASVQDLLEDYPALDARMIELAVLYAAAHPQRGRPRTATLPKGARIITDRWVKRRPA